MLAGLLLAAALLGAIWLMNKFWDDWCRMHGTDREDEGGPLI